MTRGVADQIGLSMHGHLQSHVAVAEAVNVVLDMHGNAVVSSREDAPLAYSNRSDFCAGVFTPTGDDAGLTQEALIPVGRGLGRAHFRRVAHQCERQSLFRIQRTNRQCAVLEVGAVIGVAVVGALWRMAFAQGSMQRGMDSILRELQLLRADLRSDIEALEDRVVDHETRIRDLERR
jgi:hypothetical protein